MCLTSYSVSSLESYILPLWTDTPNKTNFLALPSPPRPWFTRAGRSRAVVLRPPLLHSPQPPHPIGRFPFDSRQERRGESQSSAKFSGMKSLSSAATPFYVFIPSLYPGMVVFYQLPVVFILEGSLTLFIPALHTRTQPESFPSSRSIITSTERHLHKETYSSFIFIFSKCIQLFNHHHSPILEHSQHPKTCPGDRLQIIHSPTHPQLCSAIGLLSFSVNMPFLDSL